MCGDAWCDKRQLTAVAYRNIGVSKSTDIGGTLYAEGNTEGIVVNFNEDEKGRWPPEYRWVWRGPYAADARWNTRICLNTGRLLPTPSLS